MASTVRLSAGLVMAAVLIGLPALLAGKTARPASVASAEDYMMVCHTETPVHLCVELLAFTDLRTGARSARLTYYELDTIASDSRSLSCDIGPGSFSLGTEGRRLRDASLRVTLDPASPACPGSWGVWPAGPVTFAIEMTAAGGYLEQSKGHGFAQYPDASYRFAATTESWSVVAAGTVDGQDFGGATGNIQTLRRTNISRDR